MSTQRITLAQVKASRLPTSIGLCSADGPGICSILNEATLRLVQASGETGWYGTWAKVVFNVDRDDPYLTLPRTIARVIDMSVCDSPIRTQNPFFEFLQFGAGLQAPAASCSRNSCACEMQMYDRGTVPLFRDLTPGNKLRFYIMNAADTGKRIFITGVKDVNGTDIFTVDRGVTINGLAITLDNQFPFVETPIAINSLEGIQKEETVGQVKIYEVSTTTDTQIMLSVMDPTEQNAYYRRYFVQGLPERCCGCDHTEDTTVQLTAMAKLEFIPVKVDTDYLLIGNIPALKNECQAIRYEEMDSPASAQMAILRHRDAIRLLNKELTHYMGARNPALAFSPFGCETLAGAGVGMI